MFFYNYTNPGCNQNDCHIYSLATIGFKWNKNKLFSSRQAANDYMYYICKRKGYKIVKIYDDKHNKTYFTDVGVQFYIQRM